MTKKEAEYYLYELWQKGEVPQYFDKNHADYYSAIAYTIEHNQFNYEKFFDDKIIIKFGDWHVGKDYLVGKVGYDYNIVDSRLWEYSEYNDVFTWDWLIHLANKTWINKKSVKDLNNAFFFCQDFFKNKKPADLPYISTAQTLYIQKQIIEIKEEYSKILKVENGIVLSDSHNLSRYAQRVGDIKNLMIPEN